MSSEGSAFEVTDKPACVEKHTFGDWNISVSTSHILPSSCQTTNCKPDGKCIFCSYTDQLELNHLPEMVYPSNELKLEHSPSGVSINFNALDALKTIKIHGGVNIAIASANEWRSARKESGLTDKTVGDFDWTYSCDYGGNVCGCTPEATSAEIDMERLRQREPIHLYKSITLYEDELHDNGVSLLSVRIRVMPSSFFILVRHFLRVDHVILSVHDTRYFHDFTQDFVLKESSFREETVANLKLPFSVMNEPDEVTPLIPLKSCKTESLPLKK